MGVLLVHSRGGCAAVALIASPGKSAAHMVPWIGTVALKGQMVRFRAPPESEVIVRDFVPCDQLVSRLTERESDLRAAILRVATPAR